MQKDNPQYLVIYAQASKDNRSYSITFIEYDPRTGDVIGEPFSIWQPTIPSHADEAIAPFTCDLSLVPRQYQDKETGKRVQTVTVRAFGEIRQLDLKEPEFGTK